MTETLEIDIGITGTDTDEFLDSGVITGDAVANHVVAYASAANFEFHLNGLKDGPSTISAETMVSGLVVGAAAAGGTGTLYLGLYHIEA